MITLETFDALARRHQTAVFPNIVREYFQHVFLKELYNMPESKQMLFKGGTALRIVYGSPRFSEDLDFSLFGVRPQQVKKFTEDLFINTLKQIANFGVEVKLGERFGETGNGYFGTAKFQILDFQPVVVEINVSSRNGRGIEGEVDSVANDFIPTYTVVHLPVTELVEEKIFSALCSRKKPRDFYDLYFIMRNGMLSPDQKMRLSKIKEEIISDAKKINFSGELNAFLPADQRDIIKDFIRSLESEINRQVV